MSQSINQSTCLFIYLSTYLPVYTFTHLFTWATEEGLQEQCETNKGKECHQIELQEDIFPLLVALRIISRPAMLLFRGKCTEAG